MHIFPYHTHCLTGTWMCSLPASFTNTSPFWMFQFNNITSFWDLCDVVICLYELEIGLCGNVLVELGTNVTGLCWQMTGRGRRGIMSKRELILGLERWLGDRFVLFLFWGIKRFGLNTSSLYALIQSYMYTFLVISYCCNVM